MNIISHDRKYFTFVLVENGEEHEYSIPLLSSLPASYVKDIAKIAKLPDDMKGDALLEVQMDILEQFAPGLIDIATAEDIREILELWQSQGDIEPGE